MGLYESPRYYDIAFGWDMGREADFYEACFARYADGPVRRVLDLGCGTGRFLFEFARRGYAVRGIDRSTPMIEHVRRKARETGAKVSATAADMADFAMRDTFDAALSAINTFRHLLTDQEIASHFRCVGGALRPGGLYLVDFDLLGDPGRYAAGTAEEWDAQREGVAIHTVWRCATKPDLARKRIVEEAVLTVKEGDRTFQITERSTLRLWPLAEFRRVVAEASPFTIVRWHRPRWNIDESFEATDASRRVIAVLRKETR